MNWYYTVKSAEESGNPSEPWSVGKKDFMNYHNTGYISSDAYQNYATSDGISFIRYENYHELLTVRQFGGINVEIRISAEPLQYTKFDENREIVRGPDGLALSLTDEEAQAKGYPLKGADLAAFVNKRPVGFASNEFGSAGVWVVEELQRKGLGTFLLKEFMRLNPRIKRIGQMTDAGHNMTSSYHRSLIQDAINEGKPVPENVRKDYGL